MVPCLSATPTSLGAWPDRGPSTAGVDHEDPGLVPRPVTVLPNGWVPALPSPEFGSLPLERAGPPTGSPDFRACRTSGPLSS